MAVYIQRTTLKVIYFFTVIFLALPFVSSAEEKLPSSFPSKTEALKKGCTVQKIKNNIESCIFKMFDPDDFHTLLLYVYDAKPDGYFVKTDELRINSWYQKATVKYEDLLGDSVKFIKVEFEGNTGTGTLQMILAYFGWKKDRFVPVLMETLSYDEDEMPNHVSEYKMSYVLGNKGSHSVGVEMTCNFENEGSPQDIKKQWKDNLKWNDQSFSFYDKAIEQDKLHKERFAVEKNIAQTRLNLLKLTPDKTNTYTLDYLTKIKIMELTYLAK